MVYSASGISGTFSEWQSRRCSPFSSPLPRASPRGLYYLPSLFWALSRSYRRWSVTHAHLQITTACQHSHCVGKIFGKLSAAVIRQRRSPRFLNYSYLVHTVFIEHQLSLSLSISEALPLTCPSIFFIFFSLVDGKKYFQMKREKALSSRDSDRTHTHCTNLSLTTAFLGTICDFFLAATILLNVPCDTVVMAPPSEVARDLPKKKMAAEVTSSTAGRSLLQSVLVSDVESCLCPHRPTLSCFAPHSLSLSLSFSLSLWPGLRHSRMWLC